MGGQDVGRWRGDESGLLLTSMLSLGQRRARGPTVSGVSRMGMEEYQEEPRGIPLYYKEVYYQM